MKVAVVYWSGTGHTEAMAQAVAQGVQEAGAEVALLTCAEFAPHMAEAFDSLAFGCPAMGAEVLEESEFDPMFTAVEGQLTGKKIGLFGSYGWGDGEWMRTWEERCGQDGINLAADSVICNDDPDDVALAECKALGAALASM